MKKLIIICLVLIMVMASIASADIIYVDASASPSGDGTTWGTPYKYLQDGLSVADPCDEVWVAEGIYRPDEDSDDPNGRGDRTATFQLISGVAVYGGFPSGEGAWDQRDPNMYETILSGDLNGDDTKVNDPAELLYEPTRVENSYNVVLGATTDGTAVLNGFIISGANAEVANPDKGNSGLYLTCGPYTDWPPGIGPTSRYLVNNCSFIENAAGPLFGQGGGAFISGSTAIFTNCTFRGNFAGAGGGLCVRSYLAPPWLENPDTIVTLVNCTFRGNSAGSGGGMQNDEGSSPTIDKCEFIDNSADNKGGGMCNGWSSKPKVTNCTFIGNLANDHGGGMANGGSSPNVRNCTFSENLSQVSGGGMFNGWSSNPKATNCRFIGNSCSYGGGGMANDNGSSPILTNCLFSGNWAGNHGGGLANWKLCNPNLINCTFSNNESSNQGGGINNCDCSATVTNCIVCGNTAPKGAQIYNDWAGSATVTYSDIQGGWPGENNIDDDALFIDPDGLDGIIGTEGDNLRLSLWSPCIDVGDNSVVDANIPDLDGNKRIINGIVDMGAYEVLLPIEADVHIVPRVINRNNHLKRLIAIMRLPEGVSKRDVVRESFELYAGDLNSEPIGAIWERVIGWGNTTRVFILFDKDELMDAVQNNSRVELTVVGKLESGQYIQGSDTVRIIQPRWHQRRQWRLRD